MTQPRCVQLIPWCYYIGVMICIAIGNTAEHSANKKDIENDNKVHVKRENGEQSKPVNSAVFVTAGIWVSRHQVWPVQ